VLLQVAPLENLTLPLDNVAFCVKPKCPYTTQGLYVCEAFVRQDGGFNNAGTAAPARQPITCPVGCDFEVVQARYGRDQNGATSSPALLVDQIGWANGNCTCNTAGYCGPAADCNVAGACYNDQCGVVPRDTKRQYGNTPVNQIPTPTAGTIDVRTQVQAAINNCNGANNCPNSNTFGQGITACTTYDCATNDGEKTVQVITNSYFRGERRHLGSLPACCSSRL
jgi:hypothetical protein